MRRKEGPGSRALVHWRETASILEDVLVPHLAYYLPVSARNVLVHLRVSLQVIETSFFTIVTHREDPVIILGPGVVVVTKRKVRALLGRLFALLISGLIEFKFNCRNPSTASPATTRRQVEVGQ